MNYVILAICRPNFREKQNELSILMIELIAELISDVILHIDPGNCAEWLES